MGTSRTSSTSHVFHAAGRTAIGHVRYSTAGGSLWPTPTVVFATGAGALALAHTAPGQRREIRSSLESAGALFTTSSDRR